MRRLIYSLCILALLGAAACQSSGEIVYTGQNEDAREGEYIKDPEAVGTTRDRGNQQDTTRTQSNRVDIPVLEFAQISSTTKGVALRRRSGFDARYVRQSYAAGRYIDYVERRLGVDGYVDAATLEMYQAERNATLFPGLKSREELNRRSGLTRTSAYSAENRPWTQTGRSTTEGIHSNAWVEGMRAEAYLEATRARSGYESAWGSRVIGLHLWKYANREIVTDAVEITYTIVYFNTNEYNTGPTEIDEPVPYYTEYIKDSATLPKQGTSVQYIKRDGRDLLRWKFPEGIEPGETNRMTYKVTVKLDAPYESRPPDDRPGLPDREQ